MATNCLARFDSKNSYSKPTGEPNTAKATTKEADVGGQGLDSILLSRVKTGFWALDHPPVTAGIIRLIKTDIKKLPEPVKEILVKGGIKFCIASTLVDQYPALKNTEGKGYDGHTYKRCPGMFSQNTVVVCQHVVDEATDNVEPALPDASIEQTFFHEIGHALDQCGGDYSLTDEYRHCYWLDIARIPDDAASRLSYYMQKSTTGQKESCAEITSVIIGSTERNAEDIKTYFPLTMAFLRKKLNMP